MPVPWRPPADVIHLEIGEPDFDTPRHISEAAARGVLDEGLTHYTAATGIAPLREAIAADVKRWKGIDASPEQVVVTPGAKPIMFYAMLALIDEGDEVIYPNPLLIYESMARYVGGTAVAAPCGRRTTSAWTWSRSSRWSRRARG